VFYGSVFIRGVNKEILESKATLLMSFASVIHPSFTQTLDDVGFDGQRLRRRSIPLDGDSLFVDEELGEIPFDPLQSKAPW